MLNKVIVIGRTVTDMELQYTSLGKEFLKTSIAIDRNYKNKEGKKETDFFRVVIWGKLAQICAQYLKKGRLICVEGKLQTSHYRKDGEEKDRYITEIIADNVQFLERR